MVTFRGIYHLHTRVVNKKKSSGMTAPRGIIIVPLVLLALNSAIIVSHIMDH